MRLFLQVPVTWGGLPFILVFHKQHLLFLPVKDFQCYGLLLYCFLHLKLKYLYNTYLLKNYILP